MDCWRVEHGGDPLGQFRVGARGCVNLPVFLDGDAFGTFDRCFCARIDLDTQLLRFFRASDAGPNTEASRLFSLSRKSEASIPKISWWIGKTKWVPFPG